MKKTTIFASTLALSLVMATTVFAADINEKTYTMMGQTFTQTEYNKMREFMINNDLEGMNKFMLDNFGFTMKNGANCISGNNSGTTFKSNSSNSGRSCH